MCSSIRATFVESLIADLAGEQIGGLAEDTKAAMRREVTAKIGLARRHGFSNEHDVAQFVASLPAGASELPHELRSSLDDRRSTNEARLARMADHTSSPTIRSRRRRSYSRDRIAPLPLEQRCAPRPIEHWIEIRMVDSESGKPARGEEYAITLPDGSLIRGYLDTEGTALVEGLADGGECKIEFPRLDKGVWRSS